MKHIQWFPGHMTKAMRMMEENIPLCDGVIYVLDARAPIATVNQKLKNLFGNKPILYVLNKCDLADSNITDGFAKLIEKNNQISFKCVATQPSAKKQLISKIKILMSEKIQKDIQKGVNRSIKLMVSGIPNTGKSTIINMLAGEKRAITGDKAGVTRGKQWIRCDGFELLDTPGTMPPAFENQTLAKHLAYLGSINDDILDMDDLSLELLGELAVIKPELLKEKYNIEDTSSNLVMLEQVCRRRGFIVKGGEFDYERGSKALIDDFRKGKIGKISLENYTDFLDYNL